MKAISTYNISRLSNIFAQTDSSRDFLFIGEEQYVPTIEEPFRTDTYVIGFLKEGQLSISVGLTTEIATGPCIMTLGPYIIRSVQKVAHNPRLDVIFFKENFFLENQSDVFYLLKYGFFQHEDSHFFPLSENNAAKFNIIYDLIRAALREEHQHTNNIIRSYLNILLCEIDAAAGLKEANPKTTAKISPLLSNFKALLSKEILQQRSVRFYASQLNVTPKHLSEVIKEYTGRTAGEWIDQTLILEAKVLLQRKDLSISQVSDLLNFSDQSVFGKFFKVNAGMSPLNYRNTLS